MIPYVRTFDFTYGQADTISERVSRIIAPNAGPLTFTGTGTYLVAAPDRRGEVAIIDPGPADEKHLLALLDAIAERSVSHIFVTHTHPDHSPLARPLGEATGARIYAARPPSQEKRTVEVGEANDAAFQPDWVLEDGQSIIGDGWTLEAIATPGHASNHMAFALLEENALFSGDHVMGWSTTVVAPPDGSMRDYMASLDKVIARDFDTIWPTHGPPILDVKPFLDAYRAHRLEREAQIVARLRAGDRTIAQMVGVLYAAVDEKLWPAASLSVLAHLIKLVEEGVATAPPSPTLSAEFRLA